MLNLNSKGVIIASELFAAGMGITFGVMTRPMVCDFLKMEKRKSKKEKILSQDIEEEEIDDAE